ncbi:GNAT family N-acetyltransferase [Paraburkholderia tropica]|uniref:Acetyltransferase n=1 Tax=Paraburkholderia tropica TaxID=92647 RepID=A0AAQ1GEZ8_9BURK|nr:GNAT family N-acetyltransferase [Paraburkholderia tropica]RQN38814.1 GNAT family N-acetyltransferase [Paraburkholderia tropica]SEJ60065.1 putative acetyltransferase [Paraburkholderia tropica]
MSNNANPQTGGPLVLRGIRERDAEQLHALIYAPSMAHGDPQTPFRTLESTREWIAKRTPQLIMIGAWMGEELVGEGQVQVGRMRRAHVAEIGVGVHGDWQRRGVGSRLMAEMLDLADNWLGLRRLELKVFVDNEGAIALYRKFGFEIEGRLRGNMLRDGAYIDSFLMGRLREPLPYIDSEAS